MAIKVTGHFVGACIVALSLGLFAAQLVAKAQSADAEAGDALRPLYALQADIADGKEVASATCEKCHGMDGIGHDKGAPNIAGQRASYVYLELKAYQGGARNNADMTQKVKFLSDEALVKVAAYYASLEPAPTPAGPAPKILDPVAEGEAAAVPCAKCHGDRGISHTAGIPNLIGLTQKYFVETLKSYQTEDRKLDEKNARMKELISKLSDDDVKHIALYFALQSTGLTRAQTAAEGNASVTKDSLGRCVKCHGEDGVGVNPATPSVAGQDWTYLVRSLHGYKDGSRDDDVMGPRAAKLNDDDMLNLGAYYSSLTPKPTGVLKPLTPEEWADKCDRCHGTGGNSVQPNVPALAAQRQDYLELVLHAYQSGARKSSAMAAMSAVLTDDDIKGIAIYYAYQKARSFIFVPVPTK